MCFSVLGQVTQSHPAGPTHQMTLPRSHSLEATPYFIWNECQALLLLIIYFTWTMWVQFWMPHCWDGYSVSTFFISLTPYMSPRGTPLIPAPPPPLCFPEWKHHKMQFSENIVIGEGEIEIIIIFFFLTNHSRHRNGLQRSSVTGWAEGPVEWWTFKTSSSKVLWAITSMVVLPMLVNFQSQNKTLGKNRVLFYQV